MAIIYSYPLVSSLESGDLIVISRHDEDFGFRTLNTNVNSILDYVLSNITFPIQTLNETLINGNSSLLDAKIGSLYLYDESPSVDNYLSIVADKARFNFHNNNEDSYGYIGQDTIFLKDSSSDFGLYVTKPSLTSENVTATFQNKSGTIAYLSDINYNLYAGTEDSQKISNSIVETTLIPNGVGTLSVQADNFYVGNSFKASMSGELSSSNNQVFKIRIRVNGNIIFESEEKTISDLEKSLFNSNIDFTVRKDGVNGELAFTGNFGYTDINQGILQAVSGFGFYDIVTIDTTIENTLDITWQWSEAFESNSITTKIFTLNKTY